MMDRSLETVTELHAVGVRAIDRRSNNHTDSACRVRNAIVCRHDFFLSNDLRADAVDKRMFRHRSVSVEIDFDKVPTNKIDWTTL
nr:hypothetical protein [Crateriforma conspicua]